MAAGGVAVVGSANADLVLPVGRLPRPGETVLATGRSVSAGGKGLNQAVAAARAGARTSFVTALGPDAEGTELRAVLDAEGVRATVRESSLPTGLAVVMVDERGENSIVVAPGANADLVDLTPQELAAVVGATVLLMQLEVPIPTVAAAAQAARAAGTMVVLNAAPAAVLGDDVLECVDVLVVNEGEARTLAGPDAEGTTLRGAAEVETLVLALLERVPTVVVTLGAAGAVLAARDGTRHVEPARRVTVVDTTAAGDTFAGYLCAALAEGAEMPIALRRATAAASLCVQRPGAVPAVPRRIEVDALLDPAQG